MSRESHSAFFNGLQRGTVAICSALVAILLLAEVAIVLLRYCLGVGFLELQDVAAYAFAALVLLALAPALQADRHVRVDIFREHQSARLRRCFNSASVVLLLMPVFAVTLFLSLPDVLYSWQIGEASRETGGLGGLFLIKTLLPIMCVLMLLQGVRILLKNLRTPAESPSKATSKATSDRHD